MDDGLRARGIDAQRVAESGSGRSGLFGSRSSRRSRRSRLASTTAPCPFWASTADAAQEEMIKTCVAVGRCFDGWAGLEDRAPRRARVSEVARRRCSAIKRSSRSDKSDARSRHSTLWAKIGSHAMQEVECGAVDASRFAGKQCRQLEQPGVDRESIQDGGFFTAIGQLLAGRSPVQLAEKST